MADERWLPVVGFEGRYEVSDHGRVRSMRRAVLDKLGRRWTVRERILKPGDKGPMGYHGVQLGDGTGRIVQRYIHLLVLEAFVGDRPPGLVARHLNGDRHDNRPANLTWGTQKENIADKYRHGTDHNTNKTHCKWGHEFSTENTRREGTHRYCRACAARNRDAHRARIKARKEIA